MARKPAARAVKPSQVKDAPIVKSTEAKMVQVKITKSFDYWTIGEKFHAPLSERVLSLISGGFMEVIDHGESAPGPGPVGAGDQGGEQEGAAPESSAGAEPGEDPRTG